MWKSPNDLKGDGTALRKLSLSAKMQGKTYYQRCVNIKALAYLPLASIHLPNYPGTRPNFRPTSGSMLVRRGLRDAEGSAKKSRNFSVAVHALAQEPCLENSQPELAISRRCSSPEPFSVSFSLDVSGSFVV
jgi:hypothetical protein